MSNTVRIGNQSISYEQAKDMLFPELIPQKGNEALLSVHPHDKVEVDAFGVSAEQMKKDALEHAPVTHPASFRSMEEVLSEMMGGMPVPTPDDGQPRLYVASTETMNRGAGVLAYPDFLQEASEKIGGNFFILPSSIHELLFLKDTGDITRQELTSMVRSVNAAEVSPSEQLSDNVYHYDGKDRVFELAEKYEARKTERQTEKPSLLGTLGKAKEAQKDHPTKVKSGKVQEAVI